MVSCLFKESADIRMAEIGVIASFCCLETIDQAKE